MTRMNVQERLRARRKILDQIDQDEWHSLTRARRKRRRDMQKASRRRNR